MKQITFFSLLAAALISTARGEYMTEIPNAPPRLYTKLFGLPSWIVPPKEFHDDFFNTATIFSVVIIALSTIYATYHILAVYLPSQPAGRKTIGRFNRIIFGYLIGTTMATFAFSFMHAGKIWSAFGLLHNLYEAALLINMLVRRSPNSDHLFVPLCFAYIISVAFVVIGAPWPLDAVFFKFQGLSIDFALNFYFLRLYSHNRQIAEKVDMVSVVEDPYDDGVNDGTEQGVPPAKRGENRGRLRHMQPVHHSLLVIVAASVLHTAGNALVTFGNTFIM
ncbi:hypothetical protein BJV82DRAFT_669519 [Fennellomyces sp. T-0311]|nr:hypothetical protein BJV82DRAFT_669519 [Fennellomyces sp. T-0311]